MEKRRSYDARFYKPVCLIAVIDGVGDGVIDPQAIDPAVVIDRFHSYVQDLEADRADLGWRPFWHLTNDGAWLFSKNGRVVKPEDFGKARKPDSRGQLLTRIDSVSVPSTMLSYWKSPKELLELRRACIDILERDDEACRRIAAALGGDTGREARKEPISEKRELFGGQGFQASPEARMAVEARAMAVAQELLIEEGWEALDVSKKNCFDFLCRRNHEELYVEVKGSAGTADQIVLTRAEVDFALKNRVSMMLIVVSDIQLSRGADGGVVGSGGTTTIYRAWSPKQRSLQPISYTYVLSEEDAGA